MSCATCKSSTLATTRLYVFPSLCAALSGTDHQTELPATILSLEKLVNFHAHPNPWLQPSEATLHRGRTCGPLLLHTTENVPRLFDLCANILMTPRPPAHIPPFLEVVDWNPEQDGEPHPLLDIDAMHSRMPYLNVDELRRVVQSARSASKAANQNTNATSTIAIQARHSLFPSTHTYAAPDDAADNPYYHACPSGRHQIFDSTSDTPQPTRRLFLHAAEERLEWTTVFEQPNLPVRWLGCSPGCLAFLEEERNACDDELWGLSDDEE